MERVIQIETQTISGKSYAVVVPKALIHSFKQGIFMEDILPECMIYDLPLSDPKAAAAQLASLAQKYGNAELAGVPDTIQLFMEEHREPKSGCSTPLSKRRPVTISPKAKLSLCRSIY